MKNAVAIFLIISFASHAQVRVPMTSAVQYEYIDGKWCPYDSTAYTYSDGSGSVDTGEHYAACGYDTGTEFRMVNKKYHPYKLETVNYDADRHGAVHIIWLSKNEGWTISEIALLEFDSYGDTVDFKHGLWDAAHDDWITDDAIYLDYDPQRRCTYRLHYVYEIQRSYGSSTLDSMRYDEAGLFREHLRWHEDSLHHNKLLLRETYEYNAVRQLICRTEYMPNDSMFIDSLNYDSLGRLSEETFSSRHPARHTNKLLGYMEYKYNDTLHQTEKRHRQIDCPTDEADRIATDTFHRFLKVTSIADVIYYKTDQWGNLLSIASGGKEVMPEWNYDCSDRTFIKRNGVLIDSTIHSKYDPDARKWEPVDGYRYHYKEDK